NDCLRTVKVSRASCPWRLMTTPSNTCTRRRDPSMTWKCTFTRSPGAKRGTRRSWARSMVSMTLLMVVTGEAGRPEGRRVNRAARGAMVADAHPAAGRLACSGLATGTSFSAALTAPLLDPPMIARQQHLRHAPAAVLGWAGVVGVLGGPAERGAEGLL